MATVARTFLVDDLDGSTEDVANIRISLDGANFEIDLSAANVTRLRESWPNTWSTAPGSRRSGPADPGESSSLQPRGETRSRRSGTGPGRTGTRCRPRGRIPRSIQDAFAAAH